jgi:hypothetical protein
VMREVGTGFTGRWQLELMRIMIAGMQKGEGGDMST